MAPFSFLRYYLTPSVSYVSELDQHMYRFSRPEAKSPRTCAVPLIIDPLTPKNAQLVPEIVEEAEGLEQAGRKHVRENCLIHIFRTLADVGQDTSFPLIPPKQVLTRE